VAKIIELHQKLAKIVLTILTGKTWYSRTPIYLASREKANLHGKWRGTVKIIIDDIYLHPNPVFGREVFERNLRYMEGHGKSKWRFYFILELLNGGGGDTFIIRKKPKL
jgi:hypothetical protein